NKSDAPFEIGGRDGKRQFIPVAVYEVAADGTLTALSNGTTASIADETLAEAAAQTADEREGSGLLNSVGLYYTKHTTDNGTYIAFADKGSAESWQSLALTLAAVGVGALLIFFVISLFFSKWALGPVEASWRKQQQFVADASHELKTPLTVMLANTSILLKHPEKTIASQSQWVESVETEAELMQRLVGDLLFLATPNATRREYALSPTDLSDIVERNLLQFESVAFEREITVDSEIEEGITVMGNAVRLERLVSTLLDNAYKYAEDKGTIGVTLKHSARRVELAISNSGTSIDPKDLPHIFDRFYRADKARERSVGGYGLGLAIAHEVAEEHGGTIAAHSSESGDTVFTVVLPIEKQNLRLDESNT
ncbi:MAG: HAMP domain-containing sensor histidine kinase, partial [Raoultibacter sp.]